MFELDAGELQRPLGARDAPHVTLHLRRLAEQHVHRHVDHAFATGTVFQDQLRRLAGHADHRERAALARAHLLEQRQPVRIERDDIALLALVAPDLLGCQATLLERHFAQIEDRTTAGAVDQLGKGIADAAGADVVDRQDRVVFTERPAVVDDLLRAALDLRVASLHRIEIERRGVAARGHRAGRATAHADAHARPADLNQQRAGGESLLARLRVADGADAAGDHDRLVVAASNAGDRLFVDAEIAGQVGAAEFVVEGGPAERALGHDLQRRRDVAGFADRRALPRLVGAGQMQVADREAGQAGLRPRAPAGRALVAEFATGAGRCAGKRRDRGRVVVRLDLHQHMRDLVARAVGRGIRESLRQPALDAPAGHHRGVVVVGDHRSLRRRLLGVADHAEHRQRLRAGRR